MLTCFRCGKPSKLSPCNECRTLDEQRNQTKLLKEQSENIHQLQQSQRFAANELLAASQEAAALQAASAAAAIGLLKVEALRLSETQKQTQILIESTLTEDDVFKRGYNWDFIKERPNAYGILNRDGCLCFDVASLEPPLLILDKLRAAYQRGLEKRLREEVPECTISEAELIAAARNAGLLGEQSVDLEYKPPFLAKSDFSFLLRSADVKTFEKKTDKKTAIISFSIFRDARLYPDDRLNEAFFAGLESYVSTALIEENSPIKLESRLRPIRERASEMAAWEENWYRKRRRERMVAAFYGISFSIICLALAFLYIRKF